MRKPFFRPALSPPGIVHVERVMRELSRTLTADEDGDRMAGLHGLATSMMEDRVRPGSIQLKVLEWIGDRWIPLIMFVLSTGTYRHSELHRTVNVLSEYTDATPISQRVLTQKLRLMEDHGLVRRSVAPTVPIRTDYALTGLGRSFTDLLQEVMAWARGMGEPVDPDQAVAPSHGREVDKGDD